MERTFVLLLKPYLDWFDVCRMSQVCRAWRKELSDWRFWKAAFQRCFQGRRLKMRGEVLSWKKSFEIVFRDWKRRGLYAFVVQYVWQTKDLWYENGHSLYPTYKVRREIVGAFVSVHRTVRVVNCLLRGAGKISEEGVERVVEKVRFARVRDYLRLARNDKNWQTCYYQVTSPQTSNSWRRNSLHDLVASTTISFDAEKAKDPDWTEIRIRY
jgi:hypothetical protein